MEVEKMLKAIRLRYSVSYSRGRKFMVRWKKNEKKKEQAVEEVKIFIGIM